VRSVAADPLSAVRTEHPQDLVGQRAFVGLLVAGILLRIVLPLLIPLGVAIGPARMEGLNDEPSHVNYVRFLADSVSLPVQINAVDHPRAFELNDYEYYQPPVYYALSAAIHRMSGIGALAVGRFLSVIAGMATLWFLWLIGGAIGVSRGVRRAIVAFAALLPSHVYFCSVVSNDSVSWLIATMVVWVLVALVKDSDPDTRRQWQQATALAGLLALGLLVKTSIVTLYPAVAVAYGLVWWRERSLRPAAQGVAVLLVSLAVAAPWYLRNLSVYGSLTAFSVACGAPRVDTMSVAGFITFLKHSVRFFWFPMQHVPGSRIAGLMGWWGALLLVLGAAGVACRLRRTRTVAYWAILFAVLLLTTLAAYVRFNLVWPHAEGRFLFPALAPLSLFFVPGLQLLRNRIRWPHAASAALTVLVCWPWLYLLLASRSP
jgi:4-amino-4-deoxy-L-arabinose transferase-like glycosyltransferase